MGRGERNKRRIGAEYEERAAGYLREKGYRILEQNYRVRQAELDLVAMDGKTLVFFEVKYRSGEASGHPLESVTYAKQCRISRAALFYMNQKGISAEETMLRFDVIGILGDRMTHIENAFDFVMGR